MGVGDLVDKITWSFAEIISMFGGHSFASKLQEKRGYLLAAAGEADNAGDHERASELYERKKEYSDAAKQADKAEDHERASKLHKKNKDYDAAYEQQIEARVENLPTNSERKKESRLAKLCIEEDQDEYTLVPLNDDVPKQLVNQLIKYHKDKLDNPDEDVEDNTLWVRDLINLTNKYQPNQTKKIVGQYAFYLDDVDETIKYFHAYLSKEDIKKTVLKTAKEIEEWENPCWLQGDLIEISKYFLDEETTEKVKKQVFLYTLSAAFQHSRRE